LQQIGTPDDIYNRPANTYVATFIGSPTMNLVQGQVAIAGTQGQFSFASSTLTCPCPAQGAAVLGIRPEHVKLHDRGAWRGEVTIVEPTGADTYVVVRTEVGNITVRTAPNMYYKPGDIVGLELSNAHLNWFDPSSGNRLPSVG